MKVISLIVVLLSISKSEEKEEKVKIEILGERPLHLGEGPFWDEKTNTLLLVNTFVGEMIRLDVKRNRSNTYEFKDYISIVIPTTESNHKFVISKRSDLIIFDSKKNSIRNITTVYPEKFNDGKVDAKGRLWIGSLFTKSVDDNEGTLPGRGALYRLDGQKLTKMLTMSLPNGMDWSLDNRYFYIADTLERKIYSFNFDLKSGNISNKTTLLDFNNNNHFLPEELPDGMAIDKFGKLWVAIIFGSRIIQIDPKTGTIERSIETPANQTTSIAFGGHNYEDMFVTTGNRVLTEEEKRAKPYIGKTLRITAKFIKGIGPPNRVCIS